ncbi:MAG TPA: helix-turn-helix domain-containing protein [Gammaproteobacteria bacterium]|nr:helix-turn-helix domain-containing protein [Gammaproteobacteria bacterium]
MDLQASIKQTLNQYFINLDGAEAHNIYELFIAQVEKPLLSIVMQHANNNQSKAAQWLGISRNTLRKLLEKYGL